MRYFLILLLCAVWALFSGGAALSITTSTGRGAVQGAVAVHPAGRFAIFPKKQAFAKPRFPDGGLMQALENVSSSRTVVVEATPTTLRPSSVVLRAVLPRWSPARLPSADPG